MSKYISLPATIPPSKEHRNPPYSIPGVRLPSIQVYDNVVDIEFQKQVYQYLLDQVWHQQWSSIPGELQLYKPSTEDESWINSASVRRTVNMPRCLFASDESSLEKNHPIIWDLWNRINTTLDNKYEITGVPEGVYFNKHPVPDTADPALEKGWRVYANASVHDLIGLGGYAHRDTHDLADETSVTILWVANPVWYPSWGGEIQYYPEDPEGLTGDHQQFNIAGGQQQSRNFNIGWADEGKLVSLRPNRLIVHDGRTLHSTSPTRHRYNSEMSRRVAFRARLKK